MKKERLGFFKKFREYWQIPRYRSLITLGLYFVFFGCIILYLNIMNMISDKPIKVEEVDALEVYSTMDNYEYNYEITSLTSSGNVSYILSGMRYDEIDSFEILNSDFYIENNIIYSKDSSKDITDIIQIDLLMLRPNNLYSLLESSVNTEKIEYQDGKSKTIYSIPVTMFNIAFLQGIDENNTDLVEVTLYEDDNQIYEIHLDIYNLMKLVYSDIQSYTIKISYSNIDNIKGVEELK